MKLRFYNTLCDILVWVDIHVARAFLWAVAQRDKAAKKAGEL